MITLYDFHNGRLVKRESDGDPEPKAETVWIDLVNPTPQEDTATEKALSISVPTRAEMREIEASSRYYREGEAEYMTAFIVYNLEAPVPQTSTVTFIVFGNRLVTVRYTEPKSFPIFVQRCDKGDIDASSGTAILMGLLETMIHRKADLIERIQDEVDRMAPNVFEIKGGAATRNRRLDVLLKTVGRAGDVTSRVQESAMSFSRLLVYFSDVARTRREGPALQARIDTASRDINSLLEHTRFLTTRINFLLEAILGMISTEQNQIIKLFSVMAVMLMPPTLVASVYGMNFRYMPELEWWFGYPIALLLMIGSALVPFIYFRRRGWL